MMISNSILQEEKTILNIYVPKNKESKYMAKPMVLQEGIDKSLLQLEPSATLSVTDRSSRKNKKKSVRIQLTLTALSFDLIN